MCPPCSCGNWDSEVNSPELVSEPRFKPRSFWSSFNELYYSCCKEFLVSCFAVVEADIKKGKMSCPRSLSQLTIKGLETSSEYASSCYFIASEWMTSVMVHQLENEYNIRVNLKINSICTLITSISCITGFVGNLLSSYKWTSDLVFPEVSVPTVSTTWCTK